MAGVTLSDVHKKFGPVHVLKGVDLSIEDGDFAVILGPSGCGKTTLLRSIAGLDTITSGSIRIGERVVDSLPAAERELGMVFQTYALFPHLNVYKNIAFGMRMRGEPKDKIERKVAEAAAKLRLEPLLNRLPRELSGGQRQRVAIGRALVREPQAFLFDEPLSNLDAELRVDMRLELANLHQSLKTTMVYVTHDQVEAMSMADRVVLMRAGHIEQDGTPVDLYEDPANTFVARFIGTPPMNLLRLASTPSGAVIAGTEAPIVLDAKHAGGMLGIRPEHMQLAFESGVRAGVDSVEYLGGDSLVSCHVGTERVAVRVPGSVGLSPGDSTWLRWAPGAQHYFNADGVRAPLEAREPSPTLFA